MRQSSLIAALVVLVVLAAAAAWFFLRPSPSTDINATTNADVLGADIDADPLRPVPVNDAARLPMNRRDRTGRTDPTDPETTMQPGADEWLIRGKLQFTPELDKLTPNHDESVSYLRICYLADAREPGEALSLDFDLDENRAFAETYSNFDFNLEAGDPLPLGTWQVLYADDGDTPPELSRLGDVELSALKGIVTPTISGRVIDFGTVTIGVGEFFYHKVILTGRIVHSTGRALAYAGEYTLHGQFGENEEQTWDIYGQFNTAADGTFAVAAYLDHPEDLAKLLKYQWSIHRSNEWWDTEEVEPESKLPQPAWNGRQAHFGDITLAGALVEIVVTGDFETKLDAEGKLIFDRWGDYEGEYVDVNFEGSNSYYGARAFPKPQNTVLVVEEGRYIWNASASSNDFFPQFKGVLLARHGQTHRIEIDFKPYPAVSLVITAGEEAVIADTCSVAWYVMRDEKQAGNGSFYYADGARVPVSEGCQTQVYISYPGYLDATATVTPDMATLEVKLQKDDRPSATVIVVVPVFPNGIGNDPIGATLSLSLSGEHKGVSDQNVQNIAWGTAPTEQTFTVQAFGKGAVTLKGGLNWGYPNGILSGPVEFEIAAGQTKRIELPAIADPPWSKPVTSIKVEARTSGCPMNLVASLRYKDQPNPVNDSITHGGSFSVRGAPVALTDGREDYAVQFTPSDNGTATLAIELPHTIEVRLSRGGKAVDAFSVWATTTPNEKPDLSVQCEGFAIEGLAKLWVPRGLVNLDMRIEGSSVCSQQVEVIPGQVLQVEAGSELLRLTLELPDESYDPYNHDFDAPELWMMQYADSEGVWSDYSSISYATTLMVEAGKYRMVPWNGGEAFEFEMLDQDKTVRLPAIASPTFGSVILKFDVASLGDGWAGPEFYYEFTDKLNPTEQWDGHWISTSLVPDGFKLSGLPAGAEIAIWGSAWVSQGEDEYAMLLRPLSLTVTKDVQLVDAQIKRAIALDDEWYNIEARWITPVANLFQALQDSALPGRQEIAIYSSGEQQFRDWIIFPETSEEPFKIPDALRRELESRELISPVEDE